MRRALALLALILGMAPGTWLRSDPPPRSPMPEVHMAALPLPADADLAPHLGAFRLEAAWHLRSRFTKFGGYSALLIDEVGHFTALSDNGTWLHFARPGAPPFAPLAGWTGPEAGSKDESTDTESVAHDPATGTMWTGWEASNVIIRHDARGAETGRIEPPAMARWPANKGAEAMVRLADGRFVVLCECFASWSQDDHPAVVFAGDPVGGAPAVTFRFAGIPHFRPVDMAQLPDGRVLVLMRRLVWPMPPRFAGAIVLADPAHIKPGGEWRGTVVARLSSSLPIDNFEALAIEPGAIEPGATEPGAGGEVTVWLLSDDNRAVTQRTLLWQMTVDPAALR